MIKWQYHNKGDLIMLYGFATESEHYDVVMTLYKIDDCTTIHGFLSKAHIHIKDFRNLWTTIKEAVRTRYIQFEALDCHAIVYKVFLSIAESTKSKTFNGFDSQIIKIDTTKV
jgi:hypothetical protein